MVVDETGVFVSQREAPRLALVRPDAARQRPGAARAPGMLALHLALDAIERDDLGCRSGTTTCRPATWATWRRSGSATSWAGSVRLARFDPEVQRASDAQMDRRHRTRDAAFADAFALLVLSSASMAELNRRLTARGAAAVPVRSAFGPTSCSRA